MACNTDSILEQQLMCPICHGRLQDAKFLQCGHSFCNECIGTVIRDKLQLNERRMECPYCRKAVRIDCNTTKNLRSNWLANSVVEAIDSTETKSSSPYSHICDRHPKNEMKYYCEQCEVVICSECTIEDHFNHGRPQSLKVVADKVTDKIVNLIDRSNEWWMEHAQQESIIENIKLEGNQVLDNLRNDVLRQFEDRCSQLTLAKDKLLREIHDLKTSFDETVGTVLQREENVTARVSQACVSAKSKLDASDKINMISSYKDWASKLEMDLAHDVADFGNAEQELGTLRTLYFESFWSHGEIFNLGVIGHIEESDQNKVDRTSDVELADDFAEISLSEYSSQSKDDIPSIGDADDEEEQEEDSEEET